jgi:hypothetical protein
MPEIDTDILSTLVQLGSHIEDHMQNITKLCTNHPLYTTLPKNYNPAQNKIIQDTLQFYRTPEIHPKLIKHHKNSLILQLLHTDRHPIAPTYQNRYSLLDTYTEKTSEKMEEEPVSIPQTHDEHRKWITDTKIASLADTVRNKLIIDRQQAAKVADEDPPPNNIYMTSSETIVDPAPNPTPRRVRFNLIRHRNTTTSQTKLKQFQSFATALRSADQYIGIIPYANDKQHISPISTAKQIQNIDENKLKTYFRSYYAEQHFSLSGYFHIRTTLTDEELFGHKEIIEWLEFNRYNVKMSPSQDEEMIQIGALCFSSIFTYREDLKQAIFQDPLWNPDNAIINPIVDIYPADFQGPDKKTKMLFVSAEKSTQNEIIQFFFHNIHWYQQRISKWHNDGFHPIK